MTPQQQLDHFDSLTGALRDTMQRKTEDYATDDVLGIFKTVGAIWNLPPATIAGIMATIKVIRLANLSMPGKVPNNESVRDNLGDLVVYGILWDMNEKETVNNK